MQISSSIENNRTFFQKKLRPDISFDAVDRNLMIGGRDACLYCIDGFTKDDTLLKVLQAMSSIETAQMPDNANDFAALYLAYGEIGLETDSDALIIQLLSGVPFLLIDGYAQALTIDCRTYPARGVSEPEKDKVLRGSRDGFVETLVFNTALIRRRIRDPKLRMEIMNIGESSHTDIAICYMENRVDRKLLDQLREKLEAHRELYDIGLHGPDLLFYYHAEKSTPVAALGNAMHDEPGRMFFDRARRVVHEEADREAALAYALGFLCHFALDSTCHPRVEQDVRDSGVSHCEIETEFDNMLLRRDGKDPLHFLTASHIHPSMERAKVIAPFYQGITILQAYDAMKGMVAVHKLLLASSPAKRWVVLTGMKAVGRYEGLHGLVANPQPNPACAESCEQLDALYQKALPLAERLILEYRDTLQTGAPLDQAYQHTFGEN